MATSQAKKDQAIEHSRLISLVNSMADAVIAVDKDINVAIYNGAALNILDSNQDIQGKPLAKLFKPLDKDDAPIDITAFVKSADRPVTNRDWRLKYADGSSINLYTSIAPVHLGYGAGGEQGFVILLRDISHEKSLEEERDEFISVVSHELRTPVAITEGEISNAELMVEKGSGKDKVTQALDEAHKQVMFLSDMINDLSTLSRAERGVLKIEAEEFAPGDLLHELQANYKAEASAKGLKITVKTAAKLPNLHTSKLYVREILQNFITNAVKYTEKGGVILHAVVADGGAIKFSVEDTGIGISKSDQEKVFDKFFRAEDYRTRATKGTGLGLYVTQKLIRLLDAKVEISSKLDKGSTFSITVSNIDSGQE